MGRPRVSTFDSWNHLIFSAVAEDDGNKDLGFIHAIFSANTVITMHDAAPRLSVN